MTKTIRLLPLAPVLALAATLSLAACGRADDAGNTAVVETNAEIPAGELGDANAYEAQGNIADDNLLTPVDGLATNDAGANAAAPGNAF